MAEKNLRWGIIGAGRIAATEIAPAIGKLAGNELTAVVSRDQGRADAFAAEHGARRGLTSYAGMLAADDVDAVYIATPNGLHAEQVIAAAAAGKHVLCDKPLATTVADAEAAVAACHRAGVALGLMFQTRRFQGMAKAAGLVRSGAIGRVVMAQVEMSAGRNLPKSWRTDPALAGLGTINNIGVHAFDLLRYLLDSEVTEVTALVDREPGYPVDTAAAVLLRYGNGTVAYVNANQAVPFARDDVVLYGTEGRILGRNLSRPNRTGTLTLSRPGHEDEAEQAATADGYAATIEAFARAVAEGASPTPSGEDGVASVRLTTAIATALSEGRVAAVPG